MGNGFTEEAQKEWDRLPKVAQKHVLESVFCVRCLTGVTVIDYSGAIEDGVLVLHGRCKNCGQAVTRVVD